MIRDVLFALQTGGQGGPGLGMFLFQMLAFVAIIYFLMIRPKMQQEKRHKERLTQLRKGDEVVTAGGLMGKIVHLNDTDVTIKSADSRLLVQRDRIAEIRGDRDGEAAK